MEKVKNVPALRFPEFGNEWFSKKVGDVLVIGNGRDYKHLGKGEIPVYGTGGLMTRVNDHLYDGETVCIGRKGTIDKPMYFNGKIWTVDTLFYSHSFKDVLPKFVYSLFCRINWKEHNEASGVPSLSKTTISSIVVKFPSLPEQQKVASFLSAVDYKIQQLTKKKVLLEQYKKGVMQQLFSQQLRFKDDQGNAYPDWEETTLGDLVEFITTNSYSRIMLNYDDGTVRNIHYGDIHTKFKAQFRLENELVPYLNSNLDVSKIAQETYCRVGDLVIADASEDYKDVGKAIEIVSIGDEKLVAGLHTYIARDKRPNSTALGYKGHLMQSNDVRKQIMTMAVGISVLSISKTNLSKVLILLPSIKEQSKITSFLSAIDEKINGVTQQIEQTQQFKKGLLQQMFV